MNTQEHIDLDDSKNIRENAREAVKALNELETRLTRARTPRAVERCQVAIESIHEWLTANGHKAAQTDYGSYKSSWYLVPTFEEAAEAETRIRLLKTRHYVSEVQSKRKEIFSRLTALQREVTSQLERCDQDYWKLGTNSLSVSAREIELCYAELELTTKILADIGDPAGLADPLF